MRVEVGLLEHAQPRLRDLLRVEWLEGDLGSLVAVLLLRAQVQRLARPRLEHRHSGDGPVSIEQLGHAQLAGQ